MKTASKHSDERGGDGASSLSSLRRDLEAACATSMAYLPQTVVLRESRHEARLPVPVVGPSDGGLVSKWRPKERMKTGHIALVLCLNIGVDPADVIKISPCARTECWTDPFSMAPKRALGTIGKNLSLQYERLQPRASYEVQLDPNVEEVKNLCHRVRKYAKSERVLFHYNGHGVPKPTANGEIWVFNESFTQYIPLLVSELDLWLKTPSMYVFDCSAAGMIVNSFIELHERSASNSSSGSMRDCILLAACEAHETLPQSAEFPADVFTSCLTTPIKMALRWLRRRSLLDEYFDDSLIDKIPGRQNDRKTLLGDLNWILTAVTNTIAWNVLPRELFQRLFRQDLLVASLFRNFLLADRIMRSANCSPISYPILPPTHQHYMWDAWDMAAEICLSQLPSLFEDPNALFQPSPFFTEQLTAFEVWLDHGSEHKKPPQQLPIVLQVLLSQGYRFRALDLLGRFLDMGLWAVDLALSAGIYPYIVKLLQTTTPEIQKILVFIWTKILALDKVDLVKDGGHTDFIRYLDSLEAYPKQRAMAAFVLAVIVDGHSHAQEACIEAGLVNVCLKHLQCSTPNDAQTEPLFLQWLCLCLGKLWEDFPEAQVIGLRENALAIYSPLLTAPQPEVRASAIFAMGTLLDVGSELCRDDEHECENDEKIRAEFSIVRSLLSVASDGSPLVRSEVAVALGRFSFGHKTHFKSVTEIYTKPRSYSPQRKNPINIFPTRTASNPRVSTSEISHGFPSSDGSSPRSSLGILYDNMSNGFHLPTAETLDTAIYTQCVSAMFTFAKDPSPRIAKLGRQVLAIMGIEQMVTKPVKLTRSSSWFDMNGGSHVPLTFWTPPVSPPRPSYLAGMRRVYSLEFRPHLKSSPDSGLANPITVSEAPSETNERCLLPQSTIYSWSREHFSRPLLTVADESEGILAKRKERERFALEHMVKCQHSSLSKLNNQIARWDTKFETGTKAILLQPFSHIVIAADENERIGVWNYDEATLLNSFDNHVYPDKGISKLALVNELDDSLLLAASCDGNIRIWKDYTLKGEQKLVTAFLSIQGYKPGGRSLNTVVDWQQQSGYLYATGEISRIMVWDLDKEQLVNSVHYSSSDCYISAMCSRIFGNYKFDGKFKLYAVHHDKSASQVHGGQFAAGFMDGSVRIYDVRTPEALVYTTRPHVEQLERVIGIGFQPGLNPAKIVSASQAGDMKFLDIRSNSDAYLTINRGSLAALAIHRHAPIIASSSAEQLIRVFSSEGEQLNTIKYYPTTMAQKTGCKSCLTFHPYEVLLAAGSADALVSVHGD